MRYFVLLILPILITFDAYSQSSTKSQEEKESEIIDYETIKEVLKEDDLSEVTKKKKEVVSNIKKVQKMESISKYNFPSEGEIWTFMSQYWMVKNAQGVGWDFQKPDYGIAPAFKGLLEKLGYYNKTFHIMVINTPNVPHMSLPANKDEYIFLISLPFMRTLDLSKVEIALLMLEEFFRSEMGYFKKKVALDEGFLGKNFYGKDPKLDWVQNGLKKYTEIIYKKGFSFQEQFEVTRKMDEVLKSDPSLWSAYIKLLNKINRLVKLNLMYKEYNSIFPSPELQIKWLSPKKEVL